MTDVQARADSSEWARGILDAWTCGDRLALQRQLESVVAAEREDELTWLEFERWELLDGVVERMRNAINRAPEFPPACDLEVSVQLLRHLAGQRSSRTGVPILESTTVSRLTFV